MNRRRSRNTSNNTSENNSSSKENVKDMADEVQSKAKEVSNEAQDKMKEVADDVQSKAKEVADEAQNKAEEVATEKKQYIAGQLDGVAGALQKTARELDDDQAWLAQGVRKAAGSLSSASSAMRDKELSELLQTLEDYTRQQPALVLGGAAVAGFLLTRFLKSSEQHEHNENRNTHPASYSPDLK